MKRNGYFDQMEEVSHALGLLSFNFGYMVDSCSCKKTVGRERSCWHTVIGLTPAACGTPGAGISS